MKRLKVLLTVLSAILLIAMIIPTTVWATPVNQTRQHSTFALTAVQTQTTLVASPSLVLQKAIGHDTMMTALTDAVVSDKLVDAALKKDLSAHIGSIALDHSLVVASSPPAQFGFSSSLPVMTRFTMVAADISPQSEVVVVIFKSAGVVGKEISQTTLTRTVAPIGFAIAA